MIIDYFLALKINNIPSNKKTSKYSFLSRILSFPLFGLITLSIASILSIIFAVISLNNIYNENIKGEKLATTEISLSIYSIFLLITCLFVEA